MSSRSSNNKLSSSSLWTKYHFFILLFVAIVIKQLPLVSIPFNWLESYFHEVSHGIAAMLTGGKFSAYNYLLMVQGYVLRKGD